MSLPFDRTHPWRSLLAGIAAMVIAMGVGRFHYTAVLPVMQRDLGFAATLAGWLAASNFIGYLAGALFAALRVSAGRRGAWLYGGLLASIATTAAMGATTSYPLWLLLRFAAGVAAALVLVLGSAVVLERLPPRQRAPGGGLLFGGIGLGIALSTLAVDALVAHGAGWAMLWYAAAAGCIALLPLCGVLAAPIAPQGLAAVPARALPVRLPWLTAAYGCIGFGYITSATFLPLIARGAGVPASQINASWLLAGLTCIPSNVVWGWIANRIGGFRALFAALLVQIVGVGLPLVWADAHGVLASGLLFGASFIAVVSLALGLAREARPRGADRALGLMTAAYGVGQILGPVVSGLLAGRDGAFALPLLVATAVLVLGLVFLWRARPRWPTAGAPAPESAQ